MWVSELFDALSLLQQALTLMGKTEKRRSKYSENHLTLRLTVSPLGISRRSQIGRMRILFAQCLGQIILMKFFWHTTILSIRHAFLNSYILTRIVKKAPSDN